VSRCRSGTNIICYRRWCCNRIINILKRSAQMVIGYYVLQFIISYLATMLFSVIFNASRRLLLACGFVGAMGWIIYKVTRDLELGKVMASFLGSCILALMSHTMSRRYKRPVISFIVPSIISLVHVVLD